MIHSIPFETVRGAWSWPCWGSGTCWPINKCILKHIEFLNKIEKESKQKPRYEQCKCNFQQIMTNRPTNRPRRTGRVKESYTFNSYNWKASDSSCWHSWGHSRCLGGRLCWLTWPSGPGLASTRPQAPINLQNGHYIKNCVQLPEKYLGKVDKNIDNIIFFEFLDA